MVSLLAELVTLKVFLDELLAAVEVERLSVLWLLMVMHLRLWQAWWILVPLDALRCLKLVWSVLLEIWLILAQ